MAYVPVPKDLNAVKTKVLLNLTKRQLICFSLAALVGLNAVDARILAFFWGFTMLDQYIAREANEIVRVVHHIGNHHARFAPALFNPLLADTVPGAGLAEGKGEAHRRDPARRGAGASCSNNHS